MADQDRERLLAGFADHLLRNRLADERHGCFMVGWVRRFLALSPPMPGATAEECLAAYVCALEAERHEDWRAKAIAGVASATQRRSHRISNVQQGRSNVEVGMVRSALLRQGYGGK